MRLIREPRDRRRKSHADPELRIEPCDQDGFGNVCDSDYDQDGTFASAEDIALLDSAILSCVDDPANCLPGPYDITGDGTLTAGVWVGDDFWTAAATGSWIQYGAAPASGLSCADPLLDVKSGDPPCVAR